MLAGSRLVFPGLPGVSYLAHREEIDAAIRRVLDSQTYILGSEVAAFERAFAGAVGLPNAIGVASGTDAIELGLRALEIGPGARVITVSHTAVATIAAIERAGAEPLLVDIDLQTFTMDLEKLEQTLRSARRDHVRAIIPVHLYGQPAAIAEIVRLADLHGVRVLEDCAQAHGASLNGRTVGTFGHLGAFSFYPTKNLGAIGDGGAVVTDDNALAEQLRELREYGWRERYISANPGVNSRLDELQAAILSVKLGHLEAENERRRELAKIYDAGLAELPIALPVTQPGVRHAHHLYVVRFAARNEVLAFLKARGIPAQIHYPKAVHQQPAYEGRLAIGSGGLQETERASREVLTLPLHPHLSEEHIEYVVAALGEWFANVP